MKETDPSVLINGHFDSPLGSPGAGDCGSCVGEYIVSRNHLDYLKNSSLQAFIVLQRQCWN